MTIQLFGSLTSPYVRHCRIALAQTGLDFSLELTDLERSAVLSPAKRVPFLRDGPLLLTDSTVILKYVREKAGQAFLPTVQEAQLFFLANAVGESAINRMYLERDGIAPDSSEYLRRQQARVQTSLEALNGLDLAFPRPHDGHLRLAVVLGWGLFRERLDLSPHGNLRAFLQQMEAIEAFAQTAPPSP